jgi:hypothetical protein
VLAFILVITVLAIHDVLQFMLEVQQRELALEYLQLKCNNYMYCVLLVC